MKNEVKRQITQIITDYKMPLGIAVLQWFVTMILQVDRLYFSYAVETKRMLFVKMLYGLLLLVSWCYLFFVRRKIKDGEALYQRGFQVFVVYFIASMMLLLILMPGTWAWDDINVLIPLWSYSTFCPWQHIITGIYQDVLLQILPFPAGIIFFRCLISALCVGYTVAKLEAAFGIGFFRNVLLDYLAKLLPFFLPPVLMYQYSGYRIGLYVYLELGMLVMLLGAAYEKKEWSCPYLLLFCFLCVVVATWRTESFFYIPSSMLLLFFLGKRVLPNRKRLLCAVLLVCGFLGMNAWQNRELGNDNYKVISLLRPCAELIRAADYEMDSKELRLIDKVTSLEQIHNHPAFNGEGLYWSGGTVRGGYSEEEYDDFVKAIVHLSLKYPKVVIAERWNLFVSATNINGASATNVGGAATLLDEDTTNTAAIRAREQGWIAWSAPFRRIRKAFIYLLGCARFNGTPIGKLYRLVWNALIPIVFLCYAWLRNLLRKNWFAWLLCTAVLIRLPVVVLTEPAGWIMYLLSFYFLGYVYLVYQFLIWNSHRKGECENAKR